MSWLPTIEMAVHLPTVQRSDLLAAMENADRATGPDPCAYQSSDVLAQVGRRLWKEKLLTFHVQLANYLHGVQAEHHQLKTQLKCYLQSPTWVQTHIWYKLHFLYNLHILHIIVFIAWIHPQDFSFRSLPSMVTNMMNVLMPDAEIYMVSLREGVFESKLWLKLQTSNTILPWCHAEIDGDQQLNFTTSIQWPQLIDSLVSKRFLTRKTSWVTSILIYFYPDLLVG